LQIIYDIYIVFSPAPGTLDNTIPPIAMFYKVSARAVKSDAFIVKVVFSHLWIPVQRLFFGVLFDILIAGFPAKRYITHLLFYT
jgi:hypothetical protein